MRQHTAKRASIFSSLSKKSHYNGSYANRCLLVIPVAEGFETAMKTMGLRDLKCDLQADVQLSLAAIDKLQPAT